MMQMLPLRQERLKIQEIKMHKKKGEVIAQAMMVKVKRTAADYVKGFTTLKRPPLSGRPLRSFLRSFISL
jgi:hypothetical protein